MTVAVICMWLMWFCTWMHQWNPIVPPLQKSAGAMEGGGAEGGGGH